MFHDVKGARVESAATFPIVVEFLTSDGDSQRATLTLRLPFDGAIGAEEFDVSEGASAEMAWHREGVGVSTETATAGTVGLSRPERQDQDWFRIRGAVDLAFPSGAVVGEFRAVPEGLLPVSGCNSRGCTDY